MFSVHDASENLDMGAYLDKTKTEQSKTVIGFMSFPCAENTRRQAAGTCPVVNSRCLLWDVHSCRPWIFSLWMSLLWACSNAG